ncbi:MAG: hypothetical protein QCI38_02080 [Candidatus Thermoplasmatota archaeon]|nr:hypothetical protein [Candidatus Thermoplasmatota archaeon]
MIVGFEIKSIEARRMIPIGGQKNIRIDHNSTVTTISKKDAETVNVEFRFVANYSSAGIISIEGSLQYKGEVDSLVNEWEDKRRMPDQAAQEIHSAIMGNCLTEAVILARDIRLPPPIPFPQVNMPKGNQVKHVPGPEVM